MELDEKQEEKYRRLTGDPVEGLVCRLAVPSMVSMLVTAFYNMADTFFVGMLRNNSATGAVTVSGNMWGSAEYRRALVPVLTRRALLALKEVQ